MHIPPAEKCLEPAKEQDWQRAQQRILLYLHMLDIPAIETLELALEALRRAKEQNASTQTTPIAGSMQAIRSLLLERGYSSDFETTNLDHVRRRWLWPGISNHGGIRAMPVFNRGFMSPKRH